VFSFDAIILSKEGLELPRTSDQEVAEIIYQVTQAAFFDRLTEAAGLRLER
jgi:hypothetical protein